MSVKALPQRLSSLLPSQAKVPPVRAVDDRMDTTGSPVVRPQPEAVSVPACAAYSLKTTAVVRLRAQFAGEVPAATKLSWLLRRGSAVTSIGFAQLPGRAGGGGAGGGGGEGRDRLRRRVGLVADEKAPTEKK